MLPPDLGVRADADGGRVLVVAATKADVADGSISDRLLPAHRVPRIPRRAAAGCQLTRIRRPPRDGRPPPFAATPDGFRVAENTGKVRPRASPAQAVRCILSPCK